MNEVSEWILVKRGAESQKWMCFISTWGFISQVELVGYKTDRLHVRSFKVLGTVMVYSASQAFNGVPCVW